MRDLSLSIVGNLVAEPELRFTPSGVAVCRLTIAQTPRVKAGDEWKDGEPTFLDCTAWRQLAENIAESALAKGTRVLAMGDLTTQRWTDKDDPAKKHQRLMLTLTAIGPDLTWQTAAVKRMVRTKGPTDDPWATGSTSRPAGDEPAPLDDEPPF